MTAKIIDVDSHVLEPSDLWIRYLEPEFRDRAMPEKRDEKDLEYLEVDGKPAKGVRGGMLSKLSGAGRSDLEEFLSPGAVTYDQARSMASPGFDTNERIVLLDQEGSDATIL